LVDAKIDHVWYLDSGVHEVPVWNNNLYLMAQMLFKPVGSVTPPPSIGQYNGEPVSGFGGMMAGGRGMMGGGRGMMGGGGGANAEFIARRQKTDKPSTGASGLWLIKDGDNEMKLELKAEGSKLTGMLENPQMPGAIEFKDGKIEGDNISFSYVRQMNGQDFKISWTGTLSGDEIKLRREAGGGGGMPGAGRGPAPKTD
jgi:hypothetical protein